MDPTAHMQRLLWGSVVTRLVALAAELGLADLLEDGLHEVDRLAAPTGTHAGALYRVLRALAADGVFTEVAPRTFGLTPLAETLRTGAPASVRDQARYYGFAERDRALTGLDHTLRTGRPAFDDIYGTDWWHYVWLCTRERAPDVGAVGRRPQAISGLGPTDVSASVSWPVPAASSTVRSA